jgi:putative membrane protein
MSLVLAAVWITLFCCITAVLIFWIDARSSSAARKRRSQPVDPEQVLAERFARGEIDEIEYAQRLNVLRVGPPLHAYLDR